MSATHGLLLAHARVQEVLHGKQIREEGLGQSRREHARDEAGQVEERPLGQEGDEPQAGHRHRPLRGETRRRQGAVEEIELEEVFVEEVFVVEEIVLVEEELLAQIVFEEIVEEVLEEEVVRVDADRGLR